MTRKAFSKQLKSMEPRFYSIRRFYCSEMPDEVRGTDGWKILRFHSGRPNRLKYLVKYVSSMVEFDA